MDSSWKDKTCKGCVYRDGCFCRRMPSTLKVIESSFACAEYREEEE